MFGHVFFASLGVMTEWQAEFGLLNTVVLWDIPVLIVQLLLLLVLIEPSSLASSILQMSSPADESEMSD